MIHLSTYLKDKISVPAFASFNTTANYGCWLEAKSMCTGRLRGLQSSCQQGIFTLFWGLICCALSGPIPYCLLSSCEHHLCFAIRGSLEPYLLNFLFYSAETAYLSLECTRFWNISLCSFNHFQHFMYTIHTYSITSRSYMIVLSLYSNIL